MTDAPATEQVTFDMVAMNEVGIVRATGLRRRVHEGTKTLTVRRDGDAVVVEIAFGNAHPVYGPVRGKMRLTPSEAAFVATLLRGASAPGARATEVPHPSAYPSSISTSVTEATPDGVTARWRNDELERDGPPETDRMLTVRRTAEGSVRLAIDEWLRVRVPRMDMPPEHACHVANLLLEVVADLSRLGG